MKDQVPQVSVIMPIYNGEKFVSRSIESILGQSYSNFELILINDGSSDATGDICDKYAASDARVKVFHQNNQGVSAARNTGIKNAWGVYSIHIDSDDHAEKDMLSEMYGSAVKTGADITISDYYVEKDDKSIYKKQRVKNNKYDCIEQILKGEIIGSCWNKLILHKLYKDKDIKFSTDITMCEDLIVVVQLLYHCSKINYIPNAYIHYVQHKNSCTAIRAPTTFQSLFKVQEMLDGQFGSVSRLKVPLLHFKVFILGEMLMYGKYDRIVYSKKYPEAAGLIFSYPSLSISTKLFLWSLTNRHFRLFAIFDFFKQLKTGKRNVL